ncbi:15914_t:CDS:2 [Entrophospora sp. SA101]|nr:15914_t:CDS:2 [Entrophospora sp. SA101]
MDKRPKQASHFMVIFSVSFYLTTALVMVFVNKARLQQAKKEPNAIDCIIHTLEVDRE